MSMWKPAPLCSIHLSLASMTRSFRLTKKPLKCASPNDFVQIIRVNQSHWVCLLKTNCPLELWQYSQLATLWIWKSPTSRQLLTSYRCTVNQLELHFVDVQESKAALALTTALELHDPFGLSLDQAAMLEHLVGCFEEGEMLAFLYSSSARRVSRRRIKTVEKVAVHCT